MVSGWFGEGGLDVKGKCVADLVFLCSGDGT